MKRREPVRKDEVFAVVADEIRKMAENSMQSVNHIKTILREIHSVINQIVDSMNVSAQLGERQAAATEEISASMQQLATSASDIERISEVV